jgi:DNA-binding CsgD family transcriptional regulator
MESNENQEHNPPQFHEEYVGIWKEMNETHQEEAINQKYQELTKIMGQYAALNNQFISIFNTKSQRVLYMSDNYLDVMGYKCSEEDYKRWSTVYWMRDLPFQQSWFFMQMTLFFKNTVQKKLKEAGESKSLSWYMHNFKLKPPGSELKNISLTGSGLELMHDGSMLIMLLIIKDVGNLIKEKGNWWAEFHINKTDKYIFHQNDKKFNKGSILSDREREILLEIRDKLETKQIAEKLNISPHTVDKHRKNMIERTGAKDISTLIQICEIGNILGR